MLKKLGKLSTVLLINQYIYDHVTISR